MLEKRIKAEKENALNSNKEELITLIQDELVTRYFYKEGLYNFHIKNHKAIEKSIEILNSNTYNTILN